MSRQLSTVQLAASPLWMASARAARNGPSHRVRTADPTWSSDARWRASPDSTRVAHCCMAWRPPAAWAAGGVVAAAQQARKAGSQIQLESLYIHAPRRGRFDLREQ